MKKTIAILLVLVIGMVGVWAEAATDSKVLNLSTTITAINQMIVTADDTDVVWADFGTLTSAYNTTGTAYTGLSDEENYNQDGIIAYIQARSNNRGGFKIDMTASPLTSTVGSDTEYIDFVAKCGAAQVTTLDGVVTVDTATIATITYDGSEMEILKEAITVNLTEELAQAADGTYTGSITFSYTAS